MREDVDKFVSKTRKDVGRGFDDVGEWTKKAAEKATNAARDAGQAASKVVKDAAKAASNAAKDAGRAVAKGD